MIIQSGDHTSNAAKVSDNGELYTLATSISKLYMEGENGNSFYLFSGFVNITTANEECGLFYFTNTSSLDLHIAQIRTCGSTYQRWRMIKNPTSGTLISTGSSDTIPQNLNFGSGKVFNGMSRVGGTGYTVTDGTHMSQWQNMGPGHSETNLDGAITLKQNTGIALMVNLPDAVGYACTNILAFYDSE